MKTTSLVRAFRCFALCAMLAGRADISPVIVDAPFREWSVFGEESLFSTSANGVEVSWDSSRRNSYLYHPLGMTLGRSNRFDFTFQLRLAEIAIGSTPGKPYTFQIAVGLLHTTNAFDPEMFRGSGVHLTHGPRNLVEWAYFPDSGFGATIAATVATASNQIAFSHNHPIELIPGEWYTFELSFTPADQTVRSRMRRGDQGPEILKELQLGSTFENFQVNAIAIANYSDEGQGGAFAGSVRARGEIREVRVRVFDVPQIEIAVSGGKLSLTFESSADWKYWVESSADLQKWQTEAGPLPGTGAILQVPLEIAERLRLFRVRGEPSP